MKMGLTCEERSICQHLANAWNEWCRLSEKHPDDDQEFRQFIHDLQMMVAFRVARRVDPQFWTQPHKGLMGMANVQPSGSEYKNYDPIPKS